MTQIIDHTLYEITAFEKKGIQIKEGMTNG